MLAHAQTSVTVNIAVDATAPGAAIERVWPFHGYDEVNYSTTAEGRSLLGTLATIHSAPVHVRTHFLLNTGDGTPSLKWGSTNVYTEAASGSPVYSWTLTDGIMDAITGSGAFPFAEIAFMPEALSPHPTPYQNSSIYATDSGSFYPPNDYAKWSSLISTWSGHLNARYPNVAGSWLWELWNEPDTSYFHGTLADYEKLYDTTESALHGVMPAAQLGGPAVANATGTFLPQFLQHCATGTNVVTGKTGTRLDLVTFHAKGGAAIVNGHVELNLGHQLTLHQSGFSAVAGVAAFKHLPIYITEADPDGCAACPVSMTPADSYRLSPAYGAYEVAMMKRTLELEMSLGVKVGGLLTWAFTFPGTPYFSGYRVLATNGIELPVLGAFRLLGSLEGARLPVVSSGAATLASIIANSVRGSADVDAMATLDGGKIQILVWNYHDDIVSATAATIQLNVKVPASFGASVNMEHLRVDDTHGDAYTVWTSQGSPAAPSAAQIQAMKAAMPPQSLGTQTIPVAAGSATLTVSLPRFGISLLTLSSASSAPDAGITGVDAGRVDGGSQIGGRGGGAGGAPGGTGGSGKGGTGGQLGGGGQVGVGGQVGTGGQVGAGGQRGVGAQTGAAGSTTAGAGGASIDAGTGRHESATSGCACDLPETSEPSPLVVSLLLSSAAIRLRRARRNTSPSHRGLE
jgi:xylan 1,4-beta-xylosidase